MSPLSLLKKTELEAKLPGENDYVVFGGTFDPPHEGHLSVLEFLKPYFRTIIIAPTEQNPWKEDEATPFALRTKMLHLAIKEEEGVEYSTHPYLYSEELVKHLRDSRQGTLHWAVGEDSVDTVSEWRNWEALSVPMIVAPVSIDVHSTAVRDGKQALLTCLEEFTKEHRLYGRK